MALHAGDPRLVHAVSALDRHLTQMLKSGARTVDRDLTTLMADAEASAESASQKKRA